MKHRIPHILIFSLLASCSVGPYYKQLCVDVPTQWKNNTSCEGADAGAMTYLDCWWQVFEDPKLEELETRAVENNRDIYVAFERIRESRALMGIAASALYPQVFLNPQYTTTNELIKNYVNPNNKVVNNLIQSSTPFRVHELFYYFPLNLNYEVDLWGKLRDRRDAAKYQWEAQEKDYDAVMLSLTSSLAIAYYQLRALDSEIDLLLKMLQTRQKALEINQARYEGQITFYADVTLAEEEVQDTLIRYNEGLRQRNLLENQIAVLIGLPASEFCLEHLPLEGLPPCIPVGLPSDLLLRRPDIAEAELKVRSEHALVKEAYTRFFPSLTLTTTLGYESPLFKEFMKTLSRFFMFGAQSSQLVFDGFETQYNLDLQVARMKEAGGQYQQQIFVAFQEVENALGNTKSYAVQHELALSTADWAKKTYQLYFDRYRLGVIYYIDVANTERDWLNYQIAANTLHGYRFVSTIELIKSLGGGWRGE